MNPTHQPATAQTPLYRLGQAGKGGVSILRASDEVPIVYCWRLAQADEILRILNSHADLVDRVENLKQMVRECRARMSDEEFARRHRAAQEEESRTLAPYIRWLADTHIMFCKVTYIKSPDGKLEAREEYPPEVAKCVAEMQALMKTVSAAIWACHFHP